MNAFSKLAAIVSGRFEASQDDQDNLIELVAKVADKADEFRARIEMADKDYAKNKTYDYSAVLHPEDATVLEVRDVIGKAMMRLDEETRETLVYWLVEEVAARAAIERCAAQHTTVA